MKEQTFIFLGRSGCGKGTQAELLKKYLAEKSPEVPCLHLEVGAKFREFISGDSYTSRLSKDINSQGGLQPEFLAVWAWGSLMIEHMKAGEHVIIDGTPRKLHEAQVLSKALAFYGRAETHVIFLDVSRKWSREHLMARHRGDDTASDIESRLNWYDSEVVPALEYLKNDSGFRFHRIDGMQSVENVHASVVAAIESPAKRFSLANLFK